ncbi:uncharacterized protein DS421_18g622580 [Arachis hypogaea]|nr:uncharacterized protein DS421_18g622580 [Arachis hypogaea]
MGLALFWPSKAVKSNRGGVATAGTHLRRREQELKLALFFNPKRTRETRAVSEGGREEEDPVVSGPDGDGKGKVARRGGRAEWTLVRAETSLHSSETGKSGAARLRKKKKEEEGGEGNWMAASGGSCRGDGEKRERDAVSSGLAEVRPR